jgi:hypothetical protein
MPATKVPCGPEKEPFHVTGDLLWYQSLFDARYESYMYWDTCEIDASQFINIVETQVHIMRLWYWAIVTSFALEPISKVPYGPRETAISRDRWLVVVTIIV